MRGELGHFFMGEDLRPLRKPFALSCVFLYPAEGKVLFLRRKKRLPIVFFRIYACSLKDQAGKSKYPRAEILDLRTWSKLICYSPATFIPTWSNNLIEVTSQSYIASHRKLYRNPSKAI